MPSKPALLDQSSVSLSFHTSHAKLLLFDWDGTLTPIVKRPADAVPTPAIVRILEHLSSQSLTAFWVISGRDQTFLNHHFGSIQSLGLSAEHGAFVRRPHATAWEDISGSIGTAWQSVIMSIFEEFTSKTPGSWIERKNIAITWHYRSATPDQGALHSAECKQRLLDQISQSLINLEVINGKMCLEVRLRSVNKGTIVRRIVQDYGRSHGLATSPDWVLCVGDDVTDEDMFKALQNSNLPAKQIFTVSVGPSSKQTLASWYLPQPADVIALLDHLVTPPKAVHGEL